MSNNLFIKLLSARFYILGRHFSALPAKGIHSSSLRVTNKMLLTQMPSDFLGPQLANTLLGVAWEGIRPSQKLTIFYSKLQGTTHPYTEQEKFIQKAVFGKIVLTDPLDSPSYLGRGRGLGPEGGFDLDSFCAQKSFVIASPVGAWQSRARRAAQRLLDEVEANLSSGSKMPNALIGAAQDHIRSSQKLIFFYSKVFMYLVGRFSVVGRRILEAGFDLDSFRLCAAVTLRRG